jgi:hypothetical protein
MVVRLMSYRKRANDIRQNRTDWMIKLVIGSSNVSLSPPEFHRKLHRFELPYSLTSVRERDDVWWFEIRSDQVIENNEDSPRGTIDLHGLYVKEAIERTEKAIADGQRQGMDEMRVIVGKGIHSQGHVAKIKPAVQDLMRK